MHRKLKALLFPKHRNNGYYMRAGAHSYELPMNVDANYIVRIHALR